MNAPVIEHVNVTVSDLDRAIALMRDVFGWELRWRGPSKLGGETAHVGAAQSYVALYKASADAPDSANGRLNHIGVLVDDLGETERRVVAAGRRPFNHGDYTPGRRFYFLDGDDIEFEVVSYS
jgi:catechol 2,3-dioxygenase-like lactoylglutathione lyase family enzyme